MNQTDPIADMLTAMRNAGMAKKDVIEVPSSKLKRHILEIFKKYGYIQGYEELKDDKQGILKIYLRYIDGQPAFTEVVRISRPGRRIYVDVDNIPNVKRGVGIAVISTSKGVITNKEARKLKSGGEYICYIY